VFTVV